MILESKDQSAGAAAWVRGLNEMSDRHQALSWVVEAWISCLGSHRYEKRGGCQCQSRVGHPGSSSLEGGLSSTLDPVAWVSYEVS